MDDYIEIIKDYWYRLDSDPRIIFRKWMDIDNLEINNHIILYFKKLVRETEKGNLLHWLSTKDGFIAHIILLDQFSRRIYRNTEREYWNSNRVILFMDMGYEKYKKQLDILDFLVLTIPFLHIENIDYQYKTSYLVKTLIEKENRPIEKNILKIFQYNLLGRIKVLEAFGRFPKRNYILGRVSTEDEIDYLDSKENVEY